SVSGGPVTAYGLTMRVTVGAGVGGGPADGCTSRAARSDATSSAGWSFTADLRSAATVVGAAAADRRRCICRGAAGEGVGSVAGGAVSALAVATSPPF